MYSLMLTAEERRAFDWVGDRYNAGRARDRLAVQADLDDVWLERCYQCVIGCDPKISAREVCRALKDKIEVLIRRAQTIS